MQDIIVSTQQLPEKFEDVAAFAVFTQEKLKSVKAEISAMKRLGLARDVVAQKIKEAGELAEIKTRAEMKLGELTAAMPKSSGGRPEKNPSATGTSFQTKQEALDKVGIRKQAASEYERMAAHPEIVEQAMAEARDKGDVVSRSGIMKKVNAEIKRHERQNAIREQIERPKTTNHVDIFTTNKKYRVIYADPPWSYNDKQDTGMLGGAVKHYTTMLLDDICALPVPAADNAVLFMWVTSPLLEDSFKVINAWGFKYKSSFVWDKVAHNMGHYNSVRHEFLLIATRGSCTPDVKKLYDSVVSIERTDHSRKPKEFRDMIDTLYPAGERLEMFAREAPEGWDVWGNMA